MTFSWLLVFMVIVAFCHFMASVNWQPQPPRAAIAWWHWAWFFTALAVIAWLVGA